MEVAILEILRPVARILTVHLMQKLLYLTSCKKHVKDMGDKIRDLVATSDEVKNHIEAHNISNLETPVIVKGWLEKVEEIKNEVETISRIDIGCSNITRRYGVGKDAFNAAKRIEVLIDQNPGTTWDRIPIALGRVYSKQASTSAPLPSSSGGDTQRDFSSRDKPFKEALKFLQQDDKTQVIALCGMGGVGKTTMVEQLIEEAKSKKMFNQIVKAVVGRNPNMFSVQSAIADYTGGPLTEQSDSARADRLRERFENMLKAGKKILVILDDVWEKIELKNIGLVSPLSNGVKLLLTSRDENACTKIAADILSVIEVVKVQTLAEAEARNFFSLITGVSEVVDRDLYEIGCDIVKKCGHLPLAIKLIAGTLIRKEKSEWRSTLDCLENKDLREDLKGIIEVSYENLGEEEREILLLCGLHPEDSNIPIEDLTRYAWGLRLFKNVSTFGYSRGKTEKCVSNLKSANLLMDSDSDNSGCIKMHDLVLAFVVDCVSKGEDAWVINHDDESNWSEVGTSKSCKRISLSCRGKSMFPSDYKFPKLSLLKLIHGDDSLMFPSNFYEEMKNLEVIGYEIMKYPLLPTLSQYSPSLRTLCLHQCLLPFDYSCIGNLLNLEVLSFAKSNIRKLPSIFGNLKKLRLLDLTDCSNLVIAKGVLENLASLEELYTGVCDKQKGISFTNSNYEELAKISKNLCALEIEFFNNDAQPKNMLFEKLKRFKILVGRSSLENAIEKLSESDKASYKNTLMLVISKDRLLESRINELFRETEHLYLEIDSMKDLETVSIHPSPRDSSFYNLESLVVSACGNLEYLFTFNVATALSKLKTLKIAKCPIMESIIHIEGNRAQKITFPKLTVLELDDLPTFSCLCDNANVTELPRLLKLLLSRLPNITRIYHKNELAASSNISTIKDFLNEQVVIRELEELNIIDMENLEEIWHCEYISSEEVNVSKLRSIEVTRCARLVNMFPSNPVPLLRHLEELEVVNCASIKMLFNMDMDWVFKSKEGSSMLRRIEVRGCNSLVSLLPCNPMPLLCHLEELEVKDCASIERLFDIDMDRVSKIQDGNSMLRRIEVEKLGKLNEIWSVKGLYDGNIVINGFEAVESITIKSCESFKNVFEPANVNFNMRAPIDIQIVNSGECRRNKEVAKSTRELQIDVAFPSCFIHNFYHLRNLILNDWKRVEVVFEIESGSSKELAKTQQQLLLPYLKDIHLEDMEKMSHVWKCNWNEFLILQKQPDVPFRSLTTITLSKCNKIKYLFSLLMVKFLSNLKKIKIEECDGIEEVVSNMDEEMPISASSSTQTITTLFPHLDSLSLSFLPNLKVVDGAGGGKGGRNEVSSINTTTAMSINDQFKVSQVGVVPGWSLCQYSRKISMLNCNTLSSVIPSYALGQMQKLEVLEISFCDSMIEVFETEGINNIAGGSSNIAEGSSGTDPTLKSPRLDNINVPQLLHLKDVHIYSCNLLPHVFTFSALDSLKQLENLKISACWAMKVIVKEGNGKHTNDVVLSRLKFIMLTDLPNLEGFFLGINDFLWKSLELVVISECPRIRLFTSGQSTTPKLNFIDIDSRKYSLEHGLNFHVTTGLDQTQFPSLDGTNLCPATSQGEPWTFNNKVEIHVADEDDVQHIIPCNELPQLQKLEKIIVTCCDSVKEIFEVALEGTSSGFNESPTAVEIPNLREVYLYKLMDLKYIWKSNQWAILHFPNLTRLSINNCGQLKHVFTCSMAGSLLQLQELHLNSCYSLKVIFKEEQEYDGKVNEIMLPCLKSLELEWLASLKGFCLGKEAFSLPLLDTLHIYKCRNLTVFTKGHLTTPKLNAIKTKFGWLYVKEDLNSLINIKQQEGFWNMEM